MDRLLDCESIAVRCWDESTNSQPGQLTWSILGMMNNCWFRVKIKEDTSDGQKCLRFLHPAVVDDDMKGWMVEEKEAAAAAASPVVTTTKVDATKTAYTVEEVAKHSAEDDCWIILHGKVYDATPFLSDHPGGANSIVRVGGKDSTTVFDTIHSEKAHAMLEKYEIGYIGEVTEDHEDQEEGTTPPMPTRSA